MFAIGTDTFLISPLLPVLRHEFHVSTSGRMVSAYVLGYAVFALVAGPLSDQFLFRKQGRGALADSFCQCGVNY